MRRRAFIVGLGSSAVWSMGQRSTQAAIVRPDIPNLPAYGNSTLPPRIRSRIITDINGLAMHVLEAGFEPKGRPCFGNRGIQLDVREAWPAPRQASETLFPARPMGLAGIVQSAS